MENLGDKKKEMQAVSMAASFLKKQSWTTLAIAAIVLVASVFAYRWWRGGSIAMFKDASGAEGFAAGADTFTMYYAEWCPHCKTVKPQFSNFAAGGAKNINGKPVFIRMVEEKEIDTAKAPKIDGYPTFVLEKAGGSSVTYEGERTVDGWTQFLTQNL